MKRYKFWLAALCIGLLTYEGIALSNSIDGDTISEIVWTFAARYPIFNFLSGVLCGHFFWQKQK